jgi:S1-C subfamily serine protease
VIWDEAGTVVTNNHVVEGRPPVQVALASGERVAARVRATDPSTDLAVLDVERDGLPAATFFRARPQVGELAVAMGNPLGFENSVAAGTVSALDRAIPSGGQTPALVDLIQTDAAISPGNSGGALVDAERPVIGINIGYIPPQGRAVSIGFAIPSPCRNRRGGPAPRVGPGRAGLPGRGPAPAHARDRPAVGHRGARRSDRGRRATRDARRRGGIRPGDVIVGVGEKEVGIVEDLYAGLPGRAPGDDVALTVVRQGERRELSVRLGERPIG